MLSNDLLTTPAPVTTRSRSEQRPASSANWNEKIGVETERYDSDLKDHRDGTKGEDHGSTKCLLRFLTRQGVAVTVEGRIAVVIPDFS